MAVEASKRRRAAGAEVTRDGVDFRVWAPDHREVSVVIEGSDIPLTPQPGGYFGALLHGAHAGTRYRFRVDGDEKTYPDPASRFQPEGPHGDSVVVDSSVFAWTDAAWKGPDIDRLVIYEMHIGTFTREGTWRAAIEKLADLRELGITMIEMMPVHDFGGSFGWGYDGVDLWAPTRLYGAPDDLRAFVDAAHREGLAVILDVVYNHFGPDGCYLRQFTEKYFTDRYRNDWGTSVNFDGDGCQGVRDFVADNAAYWIDEYRFDGLRLDATQSLDDASGEHIIATITKRARAAARGRRTYIVAENEPQHVHLITKFGIDALWNDDWHHASHVAATGKREAYYFDYRGAPQEFISMAKLGFLFQGQTYAWQKNPRGSPTIGLPPRQLVAYLENHDQVANSARGERLHCITSPGRYRALTALLLLGPHTPMLFQGQEFAASTPFLYFADHDRKLAAAVAKGRRKFLQQFQSIAATNPPLAAPAERKTFEKSKINHEERTSHAEASALHRDLLRLRLDDAFRGQVEGAVLGPDAFVLRYLNGGKDDRVLLFNLGQELRLEIMPEPLLAPPDGKSWDIHWSSEAVAYGGGGTGPLEREEGWVIPAESALVFKAAARKPRRAPRSRSSGAADRDR